MNVSKCRRYKVPAELPLNINREQDTENINKVKLRSDSCTENTSYRDPVTNKSDKDTCCSDSEITFLSEEEPERKVLRSKVSDHYFDNETNRKSGEIVKNGRQSSVYCPRYFSPRNWMQHIV